MRFDDLADLEDVGALFRRRKKKKARGGVPARRLLARVPGVPARGIREQPLPLGATAFTVGGLTTLTLTAKPQRPFRGRRLIVDLTRSNAGGSANGLVNITSLDIGADNQLPVPAGSSMPAAAFQSTAVGVNLDMDPCQGGIEVTLGVSITAAPTVAGDRVDVSAVIIGETLS
jgi:hypothetical protein